MKVTNVIDEFVIVIHKRYRFLENYLLCDKYESIRFIDIEKDDNQSYNQKFLFKYFVILPA